MSFDRFAAAFDGWRVIPVERGGEIVATIMTRWDEIHCATKTPGKWITRKLIREVLGEILDTHGICTTFVMADNAAGHAFVQRLGFTRTRDGEMVRYELRKPRHV